MPTTSPLPPPFIETDLSISNVSKLDAIALWQDGTKYGETTPIPIIAATSPTVVEGPATSPLNSKCHYISFTIDQASIRQGNINLGLAIRNPYIFYHSNDNKYFWYSGKDIDDSWVQGFGSPYSLHNLWNAFSAGLGNDATVRKTVYDPCPPDFCMPRLNSFSAFTKDGNETDKINNINGTFDSVRNGWLFYKKRMTGSTKDPSGGTIFFCKTGLRREGSINGTYKTWGAYWTAERQVNGNYDLAKHLVLRNTNSVEPFYFHNAGGYLADSWSIRPALEEPW